MLGELYSMTIKATLYYQFVILVFILAGCTSQRFAEKEKPKTEVPKDKFSLAQFEKTFNPADYDREVNIVQRIDTADKNKLPPLEIPKDTLIIKEEAVQGFRIQVFSSSGVDEANLVKNLVQEKFVHDTVYVEYDAPVYKVRVGDFINRYEANQRLPEFVEKGYRDAWIVPDRVIQRKAERVPLPR